MIEYCVLTNFLKIKNSWKIRQIVVVIVLTIFFSENVPVEYFFPWFILVGCVTTQRNCYAKDQFNKFPMTHSCWVYLCTLQAQNLFSSAKKENISNTDTESQSTVSITVTWTVIWRFCQSAFSLRLNTKPCSSSIPNQLHFTCIVVAGQTCTPNPGPKKLTGFHNFDSCPKTPKK